MKMTNKIKTSISTMRDARLLMPQRASAEAYAQVDRFLKASATVQNGERSKAGAQAKG